MTAIRDILRRLTGQPEQAPKPDRIDYSYRVFWAKQARGWHADRRTSVLEAARHLASASGFEANAFERRYRVEGLEGEHAGASLLALIRVLEALDVVE